ncbi:MAG: hypothetical protein IT580_01045 [Verrucomicrobiales bacterium]|nr:hypothetical protein [Verrucomicrobiales bacterium]
MYSVEVADGRSAPAYVWRPFGEANEIAPGRYEVLDAVTAAAPVRFFRVATP